MHLRQRVTSRANPLIIELVQLSDYRETDAPHQAASGCAIHPPGTMDHLHDHAPPVISYCRNQFTTTPIPTV
jgi:hypothetical protein